MRQLRYRTSLAILDDGEGSLVFRLTSPNNLGFVSGSENEAGRNAQAKSGLN